MAEKDDFLEIGGKTYFKTDGGQYVNVENVNDQLNDEAMYDQGQSASMMERMGLFNPLTTDVVRSAMPQSYYAKKKLSEGAKVELEHKKTIMRIEKEKPRPEVAAQWIANDHNKEFKGNVYYPELKKMEKRLEAK
jgi:hypothetical protein